MTAGDIQSITIYIRHDPRYVMLSVDIEFSHRGEN